MQNATPKTIVVFGPNADVVGPRLQRRHPEANWLIEKDPALAINQLGRADAVVANGPSINERLMSAARNVEWFQAMTTGVETILASEHLSSRAAVCSTRGIHGPQMSELVFLLMLALARNFPTVLTNQARRVWRSWPQPTLQDKVVTIVGVGLIAEVLAPRCKAFGMIVHGVSATPRDVAGFDRIFARDELHHAVGQSDFLVLLAPHTPENFRMIDAAALAAMKPSSFLINVARGAVVDEPALIDALRERRIAGAGLDVFEVEPLPAGSPLWGLENVLVSPRVGGLSDNYVDQIMPILEHNVDAYLSGRSAEFVNRVR